MTDDTQTRSEDVPMIGDVRPSSEAPITEVAQKDSDSVALETKNEKNGAQNEKDSNSAIADSITSKDTSTSVSDAPRTTDFPGQADTPAAPINLGGAGITEGSDVSSSTQRSRTCIDCMKVYTVWCNKMPSGYDKVRAHCQ